MTLIGDVFKELLSMFAADGRLAFATLVLVAGVGVFAAAAPAEPLIAGAVLLFGCLAILVWAVSREVKGRGRE